MNITRSSREFPNEIGLMSGCQNKIERRIRLRYLMVRNIPYTKQSNSREKWKLQCERREKKSNF